MTGTREGEDATTSWFADTHLIEFAPLPYQSLDADGRLLRVNEAWLDALGYDRSTVEGMWFGELLTEESAETFGSHFPELKSSGSVTGAEFDIETGDGEIRQVSFDGRVEYDEDGEFVRTHCQFRDITERNRTRRHLERFRAALDQSNDAIFLIDPGELAIVDVNETACQRLGYSRDELLETPPEDIETELVDREAWRDHFESVSAEGKTTFEGRHRRKDGSTFPVEVALSAVPLDQEYVVAIARDLTARKEQERSLRRYKQLVNAMPEAAALYDEEANFEVVNEHLASFYGTTRENLLGRSSPLVQEIRERAEADPFQALLDGEREEVRGELEAEFPGHGRAVIDYWLSPFELEGEIAGVVAVSRDITAERDRRERIKRLSEYRRVISEVNQSLIGTDDTLRMLERTTDIVGDSDRFDCTFISLSGYRDQDFHCTSVSELTDADVEAFHTDEYMQEVFEAGVLHMEDVTTEPYEQHVGEVGPHPGVAVAITHEDRDIGVLTVHFSGAGEPRDADIELLEELADDLGLYLRAQEIDRERRRQTEALAEYRAGLDTLYNAAREFLEADSAGAVEALVVDTADTIFDVPLTVYFSFDSDRNRLIPSAVSGADIEDFAEVAIEPGSSAVWEGFVGSSIQEIQHVAESWTPDFVPGNWLLVPVGNRGVILAGTDDVESFPDRSFELGRLLSSIAINAFQHIERDARIEAQQRELEVTNQRLEELTRVNEQARQLQSRLFQAGSRADIESTVTDSLSDLETVDFVWIGEYRTGSDRLEVSQMAGQSAGYVDDLDLALGGGSEEPSIRAAVERTPIAENAIDDVGTREGWRGAALSRGFLSTISVPITHDGMLYGVLSIYWNEPLSFIDQRRVVYGELGETIAQAITMVEQRRSMGTEERIQLEFETDAPDLPMVRLSEKLGAKFRMESVVELQEDRYNLYGRVSDVGPDEFTSAATTLEPVMSVRALGTDTGDLRVELTVRGDVPPATILRLGGAFEELRCTPGGSSLRARFRGKGTINAIIEAFIEQHPEWRLKARRSSPEPAPQPSGEDVRDQLSKRQLEILKAGLESGYFEWPRKISGEELAEMFDVTPPTIYRHVRLATGTMAEGVIKSE